MPNTDAHLIDARVVRDFFLGTISGRALAEVSEYAFTQTSIDVRRLNWKDLDSEFVVSLTTWSSSATQS